MAAGEQLLVGRSDGGGYRADQGGLETDLQDASHFHVGDLANQAQSAFGMGDRLDVSEASSRSARGLQP